MNIEDFKAKIEWEGGIFEALEYGLKYSDIDQSDWFTPTAVAWKKVEDWYDVMKWDLKTLEKLV